MNSPTTDNPCFTHCDPKCAAFTQSSDIPADCPSTRYACPAPDGSPAAVALLPCPFCGSRLIQRMAAMGEFWIRCRQCACSTDMRATQAEADELWNLRHQPQALKRKLNKMDTNLTTKGRARCK
jgi:hypothetical protein